MTAVFFFSHNKSRLVPISRRSFFTDYIWRLWSNVAFLAPTQFRRQPSSPARTDFLARLRSDLTAFFDVEESFYATDCPRTRRRRRSELKSAKNEVRKNLHYIPPETKMPWSTLWRRRLYRLIVVGWWPFERFVISVWWQSRRSQHTYQRILSWCDCVLIREKGNARKLPAFTEEETPHQKQCGVHHPFIIICPFLCWCRRLKWLKKL